MQKKELLFRRDDLKILIVIIVITLIGLIFFGFFNWNKTISEIKNLNHGVYYTKGFVSSVKHYKNLTFFYLSDKNTSIKSVVFKNIDIQNGDFVEGTCKIQKYKGEKECIFNLRKKH